MFTQSWTFGSVWPSREMWLCQNINVSGLCEKNKPKPTTAVCLAWLQNQSYRKSGIALPWEGPAGQPVPFFFVGYHIQINKLEKNQPNNFWNIPFQEKKKNPTDLKQFKIKLCFCRQCHWVLPLGGISGVLGSKALHQCRFPLVPFLSEVLHPLSLQ